MNEEMKKSLTVGDIDIIKDVLKEKQEKETDAAKKEKYAELVEKLNEMEIRS